MIQQKLTNIGTERGRRDWSNVAHVILNIALPIVLLLMIRNNLIELSIVLALFSKWRVFTVKPRHLLANIRSNATDIIVKLSTLSFIIQSDTLSVQIAWTLWYIVWLTLIKPRSEIAWIGVQAQAAQIIGISALLQFSDRVPELTVLFSAWIIGVVSARHFVSSYEEPWLQPISYVWGLFVAQLTWVLYRWLLVYLFVPQIVLILTVVSYALGSIYHAHKNEKLKQTFVRQQLIMTGLVLLVVVVLADWQGQV